MITSSKALHQFISKVGDFDGIFHCEPSTPTTVVKEMLFDILKVIGQIEDAQLAKQKEENLPKQDDCVSENISLEA